MLTDVSDDENMTVNRLPKARIECTVKFTKEDVKPAEERATAKLSEKVKVDGFRPGKAPADILQSRIDPDKLFEETIRELLPDTFTKLTKENEIKSIIPPKVEAESRDPLTLKITFVEKPDVTLKALSKIKVPKKEPKVTKKDIDQMVDYVMKQHQKTKEADRASDKGDQVTIDFWGEDMAGAEIEGTRTQGHQVVIGSSTLIPGFEDELKGLKKGEEKTFTITFPEKYQAEQLRVILCRRLRSATSANSSVRPWILRLSRIRSNITMVSLTE